MFDFYCDKIIFETKIILSKNHDSFILLLFIEFTLKQAYNISIQMFTF